MAAGLEDESDPNADMWATAAESREQVVGLYRRAWAHADASIGALELDAIGHVPWWPPERSEVTLHRVLVHMIAETNRHAGQADIVRELLDGAVGVRPGNDGMAAVEPRGGRATAAAWSAQRLTPTRTRRSRPATPLGRPGLW